MKQEHTTKFPRGGYFPTNYFEKSPFLLSALARHRLYRPHLRPTPASALSRIMAKTAKNTEKKSLFVSFLTDLAGFAPYHSAIWKSGKAVLRVAVSRCPPTPTERTRNLTGRMDAQRPAFDGFR